MEFARCKAPVSLALQFTGERKLNNGDVVHVFRVMGGLAVFERTTRKSPPEGEPKAIWERLIIKHK